MVNCKDKYYRGTKTHRKAQIYEPLNKYGCKRIGCTSCVFFLFKDKIQSPDFCAQSHV